MSSEGLERIMLTWAKEQCDRANTLAKEYRNKDRELCFLLNRVSDSCSDLIDELTGQGFEFTKRGWEDVDPI